VTSSTVREAYDRIAALTDCELLRREYDVALRHNRLAAPDSAEYEIALVQMQAADDRMQACGCFDPPATPALG